MSKKLGRPLKLTEIKKVHTLRKNGMTFREIAAKMNSDVKSVYRWYSYPVGRIVDKVLDSVGEKA